MCDRHAAVVDRDVRISELRALIRRDEAVARRAGTSDAARAGAQTRIERHRNELSGLDRRAVA